MISTNNADRFTAPMEDLSLYFLDNLMNPNNPDVRARVYSAQLLMENFSVNCLDSKPENFKGNMEKEITDLRWQFAEFRWYFADFCCDFPPIHYQDYKVTSRGRLMKIGKNFTVDFARLFGI